MWPPTSTWGRVPVQIQPTSVQRSQNPPITDTQEHKQCQTDLSWRERERHTHVCLWFITAVQRLNSRAMCVCTHVKQFTHTHTCCVTNFAVDRLTAGALMVCDSKVPGSVLMHKHEKCLDEYLGELYKSYKEVWPIFHHNSRWNII